MLFKKIKKTIVLMTLIFALLLGGCEFNWDKLNLKKNETKPKLIKVEITFSNGEKLEGYVTGLRLDKDSEVYTGGSSSTYIYDSKGNIIGSFNYNGILYIKIIK